MVQGETKTRSRFEQRDDSEVVLGRLAPREPGSLGRDPQVRGFSARGLPPTVSRRCCWPETWTRVCASGGTR
jgi:hypothetical protein